MVFTTQKGTLFEHRNLLRDFYRIRNRGHLPRIRFHDLRHSAATILKMAGVPDQAIQNMLGHASVRTTQEIYIHLTLDAQKHAAAKMDEIFGPVAVTVAAKTRETSRAENVSDRKEWSGRVDSNHRPPGPEPKTQRVSIRYNRAQGLRSLAQCC